MVANKGHLEKTRSQILPEAPGLKSVRWRGNRSVRMPVTKMSSCRAMARRSSSASISSPPLSSLPLTLAIWSRANAAATCQVHNLALHHCLQNIFNPPVQGQSQPGELLPKATLGNMRASGSEARPVNVSAEYVATSSDVKLMTMNVRSFRVVDHPTQLFYCKYTNLKKKQHDHL